MAVSEKSRSFPAEASAHRPVGSEGTAPKPLPTASARVLDADAQREEKIRAEVAERVARAKAVVRGAYPAGFESDETWQAMSMAQSMRVIAEDNASHQRGVANLLEKLTNFDDLSAFWELFNFTAAMLRSQAHLMEAAVRAAHYEEHSK